ncbi:hypothetical protein IAR50_003347 [Cryptococcus sp. DSM 104548]
MERQISEQLFYYDIDLVILTSYDSWIPFQRDTHIRNLIRMGRPTHRTEPGIPPNPNDLSPTELVVAAVMPKGPTNRLDRTFRPLPVAPLPQSSLDSLEKMARKAQRSSALGGVVSDVDGWQ